MTKEQLALVSILLLGSIQAAVAQEVEVARSNKTIEVTATESIEVEPEVALIRVGYENYGRTKDVTFEENVSVASRILKSFLEAGVLKGSIQTTRIGLGEVGLWENLPKEMRAELKFRASQYWNLLVPVPQAEGVVQLAVSAGANHLEEVEWQVKDPTGLESKANSAALVKARALASQMAKELGIRLGEVLYVSNTPRRDAGMPFSTVEVAATTAPPPPKVQLLPKKVRQEATVRVIFAVE